VREVMAVAKGRLAGQSYQPGIGRMGLVCGGRDVSSKHQVDRLQHVGAAVQVDAAGVNSDIFEAIIASRIDANLNFRCPILV
jgi:hypothetical protein